MRSNFRLARIAGIDINAHVSFLALPLIFGAMYGSRYGWGVGLRAFALVWIVFACVVGHELCHAFKARSYGIEVRDIRLYLIGGMAGLGRIPHEPRKEFMISIVGPLFNFALAAVLFLPLYHLLGPETLFRPTLDTWPGTIANAFWINPVLGAFNLLPAYPMDGGRILRAALASRMDRGRATRISANVGVLFAILFLILGIWDRNWMLILIAFFIYSAASHEARR